MRILMALSALLLCMVSPVLAGDYVATVKETSGEVIVQRGGEKLLAETRLQLLKSDVVRTGADGSAGFTFLDGTRIGLGPSSELQLSQYTFEPQDKRYAFDMFMKKGSAVYSSGKLGSLSPESVSFRTPLVTVGVRGTKFCIEVQ